MNLGGIYSLCVKYENDDTYYMVPVPNKYDDICRMKTRIEIIDMFTSQFGNLKTLEDYLHERFGKDKKIERVAIKYKHNNIKEIPIMVHDKDYSNVCIDYNDSKYASDKTKNYINTKFSCVRSVISKLIRYTENDELFASHIYENAYLINNMQHLYENLLDYRELYKNKDDKCKQVYCIIENEIVSSYTIFRKLYTWINCVDNINLLEESNKELKEFKKQVMATGDQELEELYNEAVKLGLDVSDIEEIVKTRGISKYGFLFK